MESPTSQQTQPAVAIPQNSCIILRKDGQVDRLTDRSLEEYAQESKDGNLAWINWSAEENEKVFEGVAQADGGAVVVYPDARHLHNYRDRRVVPVGAPRLEEAGRGVKP